MNIKFEQKDKQQHISRVSLITSIKELRWSLAIALNNTGSLMVASCDNFIKVWKMIGKPKQLRKLATPDCVYSIVLSKKVFWFVTSGQSGILQVWNDQLLTQSEQQHTNEVTQLILNKNEDQIISCGNKIIKIWKVDCQKIQYEYDLILKCPKFNSSLSLNESETFLVSSNENGNITLWNKDDQKKWKYQDEIQMNLLGCKLCFISDSLFIWQHFEGFVSEIFEVKNEKLIQRPELTFKLNSELACDNQLFPISYNSRKQIVVLNQNRYIYFLKKQDDDKLMVISDSIDCMSSYNYGGLNQNADMLVVWNKLLEFYRVYKIK